MSFWNSWNPSGRRNVRGGGGYSSFHDGDRYDPYFMALARNQMNPGTGSGGYGVGQSPEELLKKAQLENVRANTANMSTLQKLSISEDKLLPFAKYLAGQGGAAPEITFTNPDMFQSNQGIRFPQGQTQTQTPESMQSYGLRPQSYDPFQPFGGFGFR